MSDEEDKADLGEEMMTVAAIPGAGASSTPNNPNVSNFDEPFKKRFAAFRRQVLLKRRVTW
jgi:hypothetical protein